MKTCCRSGRVLFAALVLSGWTVGVAGAGVVFSDDFESGVLDATRWTAQVDAGCTLSVIDGMLHGFFDGAGAPHRAYAHSVPITLPVGWTAVVVRGQWAYNYWISGELLMTLKDADVPDNGLIVNYATYHGQFWANEIGGTADILQRSPPPTLRDFQWVVTPTGWTFSEYVADQWQTLADRPATVLAGAENLQLSIGGWEYSRYYVFQHVTYDNIVVEIIPEPASAMLIVMLAGLTLPRSRHS